MNAKPMLIAASLIALAGVAALPLATADPGYSLVQCVEDQSLVLPGPNGACQGTFGAEDAPQEATECALAISHVDQTEITNECTQA